MQVEIKYMTIKIPKEIKVNGNVYPNHPRNFSVVKEYEKTKDESVLDNLVDFSLDF